MFAEKHSLTGSWLFPRRSTTVEWAKSHNFPSYKKAKMEDTRFLDLRIKVGFPYLYCHQGDCEHLVIITDVRRVPSSDHMHTLLLTILCFLSTQVKWF